MGNLNTTDFAESIKKVAEAKVDIRLAIMEKGVDITESTPLSEYANKIKNIPTSEGGDSISPESIQALSDLINGWDSAIRIALWDGGEAIINNGEMTIYSGEISEEDYFVPSIWQLRFGNGVTAVNRIDGSLLNQLNNYAYMFNSDTLESINGVYFEGVGDSRTGNQMFRNSKVSDVSNLGLENIEFNDVYGMFWNCANLTSLPYSLNTVNVPNFRNFINGSSVQILPNYSYLSCDANNALNFGTCDTLQIIEGFQDLGMGFTAPRTFTIGKPYFSNLQQVSLENILNTIYNFVDPSYGYSDENPHPGFGSTLKISGYVDDWGLSEETQANYITAFASKGWTLEFV